jgi:drug/metabolite transporter (DMT)-like permease
MTRTWWFLPLFSLALGGVFLVAFAIGDDLGLGAQSFGVMAILALVLALGGRSETIRGLRGDGRDERWERIDIHATAIAGMAAITAILAMCFWEWAHGRDGSPYAQLGAISGVAYVLAVAFFRWRG